MNQTNQAFVKLLIIGDSGVGKSCILMRFVQDRFSQAFYNTIGVDFKTKHMTINGKKCKLQIWDTAGQQRFRTITANYYKGANGIMLVFDVTNQESFKNLDYWMQEIEKNGSSSSQKILVGNKVDLTAKRIITEDQAEKFAKKNGLNYVQVSACSAKNISLIFETVVKNILILKEDQENSKQSSRSGKTQNSVSIGKGDNGRSGRNNNRGSDCC